MTFDEMFYFQIQGTSMGTIFTLTHATLSMGFHEIELYAIIRNKLNLPVSKKFEKIFRWSFNNFKIKFNKAKQIVRYFKQCQPSCQPQCQPQSFMQTSDTQLSFLGVMINKEGKKIFMDIYSQPTDSRRLSPSNQTTQALLEKHTIFSC